MPVRQPPHSRYGRPWPDLALIAATTSGVAVFVNGYAVRAWSETTSAATYTAVKNAIAAVGILFLIGLVRRDRVRHGERSRSVRASLPALTYVAVFGGAVPFVLFFEGLARASTVSAAFIHKTSVIWVGILAVGLLRERLRPLHLAAVALLVAGLALLGGGVSELRPGRGEAMIFAATLLWSVEVVVAKRLLGRVPVRTVALARMGGGAAILLVFAIADGAIGDFPGLTTRHWAWAMLTGLILGSYVTVWLTALSRAPALDVTAILVGAALVTASLRWVVEGSAGWSPAGFALVAAGIALAAVAGRHGRAEASG